MQGLRQATSDLRPLVGSRIICFQTAVNQVTETIENKTADEGETTVVGAGTGASQKRKRKAFLLTE